MKGNTQYRPEWCDARAIGQIFGIGRSTLYRLADEGKIRASSLKERGKLRGKKLYSTDSIAAFIEERVVPVQEAAGKEGSA